MEKINWIHRCFIVQAPIAAQCRHVVASLSPSTANMWSTPLSPSGKEPATHYISSGMVEQSFADLLSSPDSLAEAAGLTLEDAQALVAGMHSSEGDPHEIMAWMGLSLVVEDEE